MQFTYPQKTKQRNNKFVLWFISLAFLLALLIWTSGQQHPILASHTPARVTDSQQRSMQSSQASDNFGNVVSISGDTSTVEKQVQAQAIASPIPPVLVAHSPTSNAVGVAVDTNISATFNTDMAESSVDSGSFAAHTQFGGLLTGSFSVAGDTITLNPIRDLFAGEQVQVIATAGIQGISGMSLTNPTQWGFTAGPVSNRCVGGFVDIGADLPGIRFSSVAWGDYDNDGDLDILLAGNTGSSRVSKVYRNDAGIFTDIAAGLTNVDNASVAWGDYDNDGDLDILLTGTDSFTSRVSQVYRNDAGIFSDIGAGLTAVNSGSVAWGDYDNDGDLDILLTGSTGSNGRVSKVYRNDVGIFTDIGAGLTAVRSGSVAWGDYDNDGDLDILLTGRISNDRMSQVYRNDAGIFTDITAGLTAVRNGSVAWGDYDNDGDLDILLTGFDDTNRFSIVYENNAGIFSDITAGLTAVSDGKVAWGDYDNDGDLDILLTGFDGTNRVATVYENNAGIFSDIGAGLTGVNATGGVAWGDYDNDGDLDILLTGNDGSAFISKVYRNDDCFVDIQLSKTVSPAIAHPGDTITYTLAFTNSGNVTATNVVLTDVVPTMVNVTSVISSGVAMTQSQVGNSYQWQMAAMPANSGGVITIVGDLVATATTFTNTATITTMNDANPADNVGSATVTVPSQHCGVQQGQLYKFYGANLPVTVFVNTVGDIDCLSIIRTDSSHPNGTVNMTDGYYWTITGTTSIGQPISTFDVDLTMPHSGGMNPVLCRYPGDMGGLGWDCTGVQVANGSTVTRQHVTQFSDWMVGYDVGPTAVGLLETGVHGGGMETPTFFILITLLLLTVPIYRYSRRRS